MNTGMLVEYWRYLGVSDKSSNPSSGGGAPHPVNTKERGERSIGVNCLPC